MLEGNDLKIVFFRFQMAFLTISPPYLVLSLMFIAFLASKASKALP